MDFFIVLILIVVLYMAQKPFFTSQLNKADVEVNTSYFDILFGVHLAFFFIYLMYTFTNRSDSGEYYRAAEEAESWFELWGSGTTFMRFMAFPFVNLLGLSYNSVMLIFSFLGFQGMAFLYLAARENISGLPIKWSGMTVLEIMFILPNCHFWSASLGKGSVMLFSIGLMIYGLSRFNYRIIYIAAGAFLVYMVRPHILFAIILGTAIGVMFSTKGKSFLKIPVLVVSLVAISFLSDEVIEFSGTESLNVFDSDQLSYRARELSKGGSGVDISNYNQAMKLFTFLFRPLFVDSPSAFGIITSFENLFFLVMAFEVLFFGLGQIGKWNGFFLLLFFSFLLGSIALAQVSGNLGIAMRQKAQLTPLFFMVYAKVRSIKLNRN